MVTDSSEFRYLSAQAGTLGVPVPAVERLSRDLADGRRLSALRFGTGDPVVTLLHGAGLNAHTWDTTLLLAGVPVLALDLPGHGDSSWRDDADYSPRVLAADVIVAVETWTTTPQLLVGHSLGGLTAAAVAAERPDLVSEVVLVDIVPGIDATGGPAALRAFYGVTDFASREDVVQHALSFGLGGSAEEAERGVFLNTRIRPDGRVEWKHHLARLAAQAFGGEGASTLHEDAWDDLAAVTAPLTLIRATAGFVSEENAAAFALRLPRARLLTVAAPHNVQETAPAFLADLLRERLAPSPGM